MDWEYGEYIWFELLDFIGNPIGVAGLMGNFVAESNLIPYRKQGDFTDGYTKSIAYTDEVISGEISKDDFVHDSIGYSLAQWTYWTRKQDYYELWENGSHDFGSKELAIEMIKFELENKYKSTFRVLKNAKSIREASNYVLFNYEKPADQSRRSQNIRTKNGELVYKTYSGLTPPQNHMKPYLMTGRKR